MNYEEMKVAELRKLVTDKKLAYGKCVSFAKKEDLIKLLKGEIIQLPDPGDNPPAIQDDIPDGEQPAPAPRPAFPPTQPSLFGAGAVGIPSVQQPAAPTAQNPMAVLQALGQLMGASTLNEDAELEEAKRELAEKRKLEEAKAKYEAESEALRAKAKQEGGQK